jgi:hypothetical protein
MKIETMVSLTVVVDGSARGCIAVHEDIEEHACAYCVADLLCIGVSEILSLRILDQCAYVKLATQVEQLLRSVPFVSVASPQAKKLLAGVFGEENESKPVRIDAEQLAQRTGMPASTWELWSEFWHYSVGDIKVVRFGI